MQQPLPSRAVSLAEVPSVGFTVVVVYDHGCLMLSCGLVRGRGSTSEPSLAAHAPSLRHATPWIRKWTANVLHLLTGIPQCKVSTLMRL